MERQRIKKRKKKGKGQGKNGNEDEWRRDKEKRKRKRKKGERWRGVRRDTLEGETRVDGWLLIVKKRKEFLP